MGKDIALWLAFAMLLTGCAMQKAAKPAGELPGKHGAGSAEAAGHGKKQSAERETGDAQQPETTEKKSMTITIGAEEYQVKLEENETAEALRSMLPLTLTMKDFNGNEKVTALSRPIRKEPSVCPGTIHAGDVMCYGDDRIVLFYDTFSTVYSYVKIGEADRPEEFAKALGSGSVEVLLSN
ncbi:cyclophilin-like fold protein [Acidaminobacterium chupaoyuni]